MRRRGGAITAHGHRRSHVSIAVVAALAVACDFVTPPGKSTVSALAVVAGDSQAGQVGQMLPQPVEVRAVDASGRSLSGQAISFSVTAGGGSVDSATVVTNDSGIAGTRWTLGTSVQDDQALQAATGGSDPVTVTIVATAGAGGPAAIQKAGGDNQSAAPGDPVPDSLAARLVDQFGNPVPGASLTWSTSSGSISPEHATTDAAGVARARWVLGTEAGSFSATASHDGVAPATFSAGTTLNGTTLTKTAGDAQSGPINEALPLPVVVTLRSQGGAAVSGATVTWTPADGSGSVSPASATTDGNGQAQAVWTMPGTAGPKTLTASVAGQASATFTATATAGAAATITIVSGDGQTGVVGAQLNDSLSVRLLDGAGNPVTGASVTWAVVAGGNGGSMTPATSLTNADGVASAYWALGLRADTTHAATAATGALPPVTFTATPQLPPTLALTRVAGDSQVGQVSSALADSLAVKVSLTDGRAVQGVHVTWGARDGGSIAAGQPRTAVDGTARAKWTLGATAGTQHAVARWLDALSQPVDSTTYTATAGLAPPTSSPALTVTAPLNWTVAQTSLRVTLACAFDGRPCNVTARVNGTLVATASGTMDQTLDLGSYDGQTLLLALCAEDPTATVKDSCSGRRVIVESSSHLVAAASVAGGVVLDGDGSRLVFVSDTSAALDGTFCSTRNCASVASPSVAILTRSSNAVQQIGSGAATWAHLAGSTGGALWRDAGGVFQEWHAGTTTTLAGVSAPPQVQGGFAMWIANGATMLRDVGAGTTTTVSHYAASASLTSAGDVWYQADHLEDGTSLVSQQIIRYSGGGYSAITADTAHDNQAPAAWGSAVVFWQGARSVSTGTAPVILAQSGSATVVDSSSSLLTGIRNGWVFYTPAGGGLWSRSPQGAGRQVTAAANTQGAEAFGDAGQVMFHAGGRRYLAVPDYSAAPVNVMGVEGPVTVTPVWISGSFYVPLGRTFFQVK